MDFIILFLVMQLFERYETNYIDKEYYGLREDYIPFILVICLMALIIITQAVYLTLSYYIQQQNHEDECRYCKVALENATSLTVDISDDSSRYHSKKNVRNKKESVGNTESSKKILSVLKDQRLMKAEYFPKFGKIYFSIKYDWESQTLTATLHKAKHLIGNRITGKRMFYVNLRLKTIGAPAQSEEMENICQSFRSSTISGYNNPVFDEIFVFTNVTPVTLIQNILQLVIKEEASNLADGKRDLGYVDFILKDAELLHENERIDNIHRDILPLRPVPNKGHAVLSLYYSRELAHISASVIELRTGGDDLSAVTMEMYFGSIDNVIHRMNIDLDSDLYSDEVCEFPLENRPIDSVCLVVVILAKVRNCSKTPYGRFVVGPIRFTDGPGLTHWAEMTNGEHTSIFSHAIV